MDAPVSRRSRTARLRTRLLASILGCGAAFVVGEVALRLYNPISLPLRGRQIVLPVNRTEVWRGPPAGSKIDAEIVFRNNELGFRGPSPPRDFERHLTLLAVGGSTTECLRLTEGRDWPAVLGRELTLGLERVWINNAGLDGHSTFGHAVLLDQVVLDLGPDYVLFLIGINDIGRAAGNAFDDKLDPARRVLHNKVVATSELLSTAQALYRTWRARELGLGHLWELDLATAPRLEWDAERGAALLDEHRRRYLDGYRERVIGLVRRCREAGIEPILITQPALFGEGVDPATGVDLATLEFADRPGAVAGRLLDLYNDVTRGVGRTHEVLVIDLAEALPRDSRLYYDWMHFTNDGAERVAAILAEALIPYLAERSREP